MQVASLFLLYCKKFEELQLRYMVTGSVATILYGDPRLTNDIDLVVFCKPHNGKQFDVDAFAKAFPIDEFYCPPEEILELETKRSQRGHFNLIHHETGYKADVYVANRNPFFDWALGNIRRIPVAESFISVAPPEYVLISKLSYYKEGGSEKHMTDLRGVLASGIKLDWDVIEAEAKSRGLESQLTKLREGY